MGKDEGSFPILPSISAADLSHLCRRSKTIGKGFTPIIEIGRRPRLIRTKPFAIPSGHRLIALSLRRDSVEKRQRSLMEKLQKSLKSLRSNDNTHFVYIDSVSRSALVVPNDFEAAINNGTIEKLDLSPNGQTAIVSLQGSKEQIVLPSRRIKINNELRLEEGKGQSLETLNRQRRCQRTRTSERRQIFEELQKRAQEELQRWLNPIVGKPKKLIRKVSMPKRREEEAKIFRRKLIKFRDAFIKNDKRLSKLAKTRCVGKLDWNRIARITRPDLEFRMPEKRRKRDFKNNGSNNKDNNDNSGKNIKSSNIRRRNDSRNLFGDSVIEKAKQRVRRVGQDKLKLNLASTSGLECIPWTPSDQMFSSSPFKPDQRLLHQLSTLSKTKQLGRRTLKDLMSDSKIDLLPSQSEFEAIAARLASDEEGVIVRMVRMRDGDNGVEFVDADDIENGNENVDDGVLGAVVQMDDGVVRFVPGERVCFDKNGESVFVPGQRFSELDGVFVPGACFRSDLTTDEEMSGCKMNFLPGIVAMDNKESPAFVLGRVVDDLFVQGQTVSTSRGDNVFVHGQTINSAEGLKFVAGVNVENEEGSQVFVPGVGLLDEGSDECTDFCTGQVISLDEEMGVRFISGRFINEIDDEHETNDEDNNGNNNKNNKTDNEPLFEPGQLIGDKFVPGQHVMNENGESVFVPGVFADANNENSNIDDNKDEIKGNLQGLDDKIFVPGIFKGTNESGCKDMTKLRRQNKTGKTEKPGNNDEFSEDDEYDEFEPGVFMLDEKTGTNVFVSGKMHKVGKNSLFVPGSIDTSNPTDPRFVTAANPDKILVSDVPDNLKNPIDTANFRAKNKNEKEIQISQEGRVKSGVLIRTEQGSLVFAERDSDQWKEMLKDKKKGSKGNPEIQEGRFEILDGCPVFVPGSTDEETGIFLPGKTICTKEKKPIFVPGLQLMKLNEKLKVEDEGQFVAGRIVFGNDGQPTFVPGVVVNEIDEKSGKLRKGFKPALKVQIEDQLCLVPGQVTSFSRFSGHFVPGELSRESSLFVPGVVIVDENKPRLVRGQVVETESGPHVLSAIDEDMDNVEHVKKEFDLDSNQLHVMNLVKQGKIKALDQIEQVELEELGNVETLDPYDMSEESKESKEKCLNLLSEGNENELDDDEMLGSPLAKTNDKRSKIPKKSDKKSTNSGNQDILRDESNLSSKSSSLMERIASHLVTAMHENGLDKLVDMSELEQVLRSETQTIFDFFKSSGEKRVINENKRGDDWVSPEMWLRLAKEQLKKTSKSRKEGNTMSKSCGQALVTLMAITMGHEKAKESENSSNEANDFNIEVNDERRMAKQIADETIATLRRLAKHSSINNQLEHIVKMAESQNLDETLETLRRERENMDKDHKTLVEIVQKVAGNFENARGKAAKLLESESEQISETFLKLSEQEPQILSAALEKVAKQLDQLEKNNKKSYNKHTNNERENTSNNDIVNKDASLMLHEALKEAVRESTQMEVDELITKLEKIDPSELSDEEMRQILRQAIGLARFLRQNRVAECLSQVLENPLMVSALKSDEAIRELLAQILLLRKLARQDLHRRRLLNRLDHNKEINDNIDNDDDNESSTEALNSFVQEANAYLMKRRRPSLSRTSNTNMAVKTAKDISMKTFLALKSKDNDANWLSSFLNDSVKEQVPVECSKALILLKNGFQAIVPREASRSILRGEASYTLIDDNGVHFHIAEKESNNDNEDDDLKDVLDNDPVYNQMTKDKKDDEEGRRGPVQRLSARSLTMPNLDEKGVLFSSLEKYRPHNFDKEHRRFSSRPEPKANDDDINSLRDFYSNLGTHHRAMRRLSLMQQANDNRQAHQRLHDNDHNNEQYGDEDDFSGNFKKYHNRRALGNREQSLDNDIGSYCNGDYNRSNRGNSDFGALNAKYGQRGYRGNDYDFDDDYSSRSNNFSNRRRGFANNDNDFESSRNDFSSRGSDFRRVNDYNQVGNDYRPRSNDYTSRTNDYNLRANDYDGPNYDNDVKSHRAGSQLGDNNQDPLMRRSNFRRNLDDQMENNLGKKYDDLSSVDKMENNDNAYLGRRDPMALADAVLSGEDVRLAAALNRRPILQPSTSLIRDNDDSTDSVGCDVLLADMKQKMSRRRDYSDLLRSIDNDDDEQLQADQGRVGLGRHQGDVEPKRTLRSYKSIDETPSIYNNDDDSDLKMGRRGNNLRRKSLMTLDEVDEYSGKPSNEGFRGITNNDDASKTIDNDFRRPIKDDFRGPIKDHNRRPLRDDYEPPRNLRQKSREPLLQRHSVLGADADQVPLDGAGRAARVQDVVQGEDEHVGGRRKALIEPKSEEENWMFEEQDELAAALSKLPKPKTMKERLQQKDSVE